MATFGLNAPDRVIDDFDYDSWYIAGHSLGGIVAAFYAEEHEEIVDGLILFAAYPTRKIPDSIEMLSIYGNLDGCLSMTKYEECRGNWPSESTEIIIEGGNHSRFGNYGKQQGDTDATIPASEQQGEAVEAVIKFTSNEDKG